MVVEVFDVWGINVGWKLMVIGFNLIGMDGMVVKGVMFSLLKGDVVNSGLEVNGVVVMVFEVVLNGMVGLSVVLNVDKGGGFGVIVSC